MMEMMEMMEMKRLRCLSLPSLLRRLVLVGVGGARLTREINGKDKLV
jgi:hypothetical protein